MATVILKATESCNARCVYCDVVRKERRGPAVMPLETLRLFFERSGEFMAERPGEHLEIIWHGGEPLLLGPEYFYRAREYQDRFCPGLDGRIRHTMQSNLTLFHREFSAPLRALGITSLGTSYDPVPGLRGLGASKDWEKYNRLFMDALGLLEDEGFSFGVICVLTRLSLGNPLGIYRFLSNLVPTGSFMLNPVLLYGNRREDLRITPEEYAHFLGTVYPVWREEGGQTPVEPFDSLTRALGGDTSVLMCCDSGACAHSHFNLTPDASLSHCGRSGDFGLLPYGSLFDTPLAKVMTDPMREIISARNKQLPERECKDCRHWPVCHGGCPLDAWSATGSLSGKSGWCQFKKLFIERYVEPYEQTPRHAPAARGVRASARPAPGRGPVLAGGGGDPDSPVWINPIGGLGDTLMISGVLEQVAGRDPGRRFCLVDRTKYRQILEGHPGIARIGHPPPGARFIETNYWDHEMFKQPGARAYQTLAHMFGLPLPVKERLYVPWEPRAGMPWLDMIPWRDCNVLVCPSSDSPRKCLAMDRWESLTAMLRDAGAAVVQIGRMHDRRIRGAYSLLGLTTPRQAIGMLVNFDVVVTSDNFIMHAAFMRGVPTVAIWGPTRHEVYGYHGHVHLQAEARCRFRGGCIGPGTDVVYHEPCPEREGHCLNSIAVESIRDAVLLLAEKKGPGTIPGRNAQNG